MAKLEEFLGMTLAKIPVNPAAVARWKKDQDVNYFDFFKPAMREYKYTIPRRSAKKEACLC